MLIKVLQFANVIRLQEDTTATSVTAVCKLPYCKSAVSKNTWEVYSGDSGVTVVSSSLFVCLLHEMPAV